MKFTAQQYAQALYDAISQTDSKDHDKVLDNFVKILAQNGDLGKHQAIEQAYKLLEMEEKGIHQAQLTVAREMEINSGIVNELNKIAKHKLDISKKVDAGIVGGLIMRVDDTLLDASVKMQLNKLNQLLKE